MLPLLPNRRATVSGALWILSLVVALLAPVLSGQQQAKLYATQREARRSQPVGFVAAGSLQLLAAAKHRRLTVVAPPVTGNYMPLPWTLPNGVTHSTATNAISGTPLTVRYQDNPISVWVDIDSSLSVDAVANFNYLQSLITTDASTNLRRGYEVGTTRVFYGSLVTPHNSGTEWSGIQPVGYAYNAALAVPPALSAVRPTFMTGTFDVPAFRTSTSGAADGNHGRWALMGLTFTIDPAISTSAFSTHDALVKLGAAKNGGQASTAAIPDGFLCHDLLVVGNPSQWVRRGIETHGRNIEIRAVRFNEIHSNAAGSSSSDALCIGGWNTDGRIEIAYCVIAGGDEGIIFGGASGTLTITNIVPSDIFIHHCLSVKTAAYQAQWGHKTHWELKTGIRVLFWACDAYGLGAFTGGTNNQAYTFTFKSSGGPGGNVWNLVQDATIFQCRSYNNPGFLMTLGREGGDPIIATNRLAVIDNIGYNLNVAPYQDGIRRTCWAQNGNEVIDAVIAHNTIATSDGGTSSAIFFPSQTSNGGVAAAPRVRIENNIFPVCGQFNSGVGGIWGAGQGTNVLNDAAPGPTWTYANNHWIGTTAGKNNYPPLTTTWANNAAFPFVDFATGNLRINPAAPNANLIIGAAPSGLNIGVQYPDQVYNGLALVPAL